jgi:O-antigen ligase
MSTQKEISSSSISKMAGILSNGIVLALLFYSNLSDGGVRPFPLFLSRFLVVTALLLQIPLLFSTKNYLAAFPSFSIIPISIFLVFLLVIAIQSFYGLRILEWGVGTVNPHATLSSLVQLICYFFFFILCMPFAAHRSNIESLVFWIAVLVCAITVWGIAERFVGKDLLGADHLAQDSFGPFVNPNHYSAFVALSFPLLAAYLCSRQGKRGGTLQPSHLPEDSPTFSGADNDRGGTFFLFFITLLVMAGLFLAGGRLGILLAAFSLVFYLTMQLLRRDFKQAVLALFLIFAAFLFALRLGEAEAFFRAFSMDSLKAATAERMQVAKESLNIFFQHPWLGSGLGTLPFISTKVITVLSDSVEWDHAHNDYVELLAETGTVGFFLFVGALGTVFIYGLRTFWKDTNPDSRWILFQALTAVFIIAIFEWADFPLKIPSLAFLFVMQLALLVTAIPSRSRRQQTERGIRLGLALTYFCGAIFLSGWTVKDYQSSRLAENRENHIQNLENAIELQPLNSAYWHQLGLEYLGAEGKNRTINGRDPQRQKALKALRKAVDLSPTYSRYWFSLGRLEYQEGLTEEALSSLEKAVTWAPYKFGYLLHLIAVYLRESEISGSREEQERNLNRARELFKRLRAMKNFPGKEEQKRWMGPLYAENFDQLARQWNPNQAKSL